MCVCMKGNMKLFTVFFLMQSFGEEANLGSKGSEAEVYFKTQPVFKA